MKGGAKTRQEVLLRKLFRIAPELADIFDPSIVKESGVAGRIVALSDSINQLLDQVNRKYSSKSGGDLFKATNKTAQAQIRLRKAIQDVAGYEKLIDDLYFLFWESSGTRLDAARPQSFKHVNDLRTNLRHDVDHGGASRVRAKKRKAGTTFTAYSGGESPDTIEPALFPLVQANILGAIEGDLRTLLLTV